MTGKVNVKCIAMLCVFCIVVCGRNISAKTRSKGYIGKINLQAIILLHPSMRDYDVQKKAFKDDGRLISKALLRAQFNERKIQIDALKNKAKELSSQLVMAHREHDAKLQKISDLFLAKLDKLATGAVSLNRHRYSVEESRIALTHRGRLKAIVGKMRLNQTEIDRLVGMKGGVGYSSPDDTEKKIKAIITEIHKYTKQIAASKGINIVLNSSNHNLTRVQQFLPVLPAELSYASIFKSSFPKELFKDTAAVDGHYSEVYSIIHNWLIHGNSILKPFEKQLTNTDVFVGGVDLTQEVIVKIFKAYKIDKNLTNVILRAAKDL